jgi:hypothetical protein
MRNAEFNTYDVQKACKNKLDIQFRQGSELNGWFEYKGKKACRITIPHGRKTIPPKTYCKMAAQLNLSVDEFDKFLECTLRYEDYIALQDIKV